MIPWARTLAFMALFYGGSFLLLLFGTLALLAPRPFMFGVARAWSWYHRQCCRFLLGLKIRIEGEVPAGQVLFAVKHESFFEAIDAPTFSAGPIIPFAKIELMRLPLWGVAARKYGVVGVERDAGAKAVRHITRAAREAKAEGRSFVIFPEGTRVAHDSAGKLQSGLYAIYKILAIPLVPVGVDSGPLYNAMPMRSGTLTYRVGEPLPPGLSREEMEARVMAAINALNDLPGEAETEGAGPA